MNGKILFCLGTRPEWLKIKPILNSLSRDQYKILFTGQHKDLLKDIDFDHRLVIEEFSNPDLNRLNALISSCLSCFSSISDNEFDSVLVQGDTASAYACALAAFNKGLKIYYLEAGISESYKWSAQQRGYGVAPVINYHGENVKDKV